MISKLKREKKRLTKTFRPWRISATTTVKSKLEQGLDEVEDTRRRKRVILRS